MLKDGMQLDYREIRFHYVSPTIDFLVGVHPVVKLADPPDGYVKEIITHRLLPAENILQVIPSDLDVPFCAVHYPGPATYNDKHISAVCEMVSTSM